MRNACIFNWTSFYGNFHTTRSLRQFCVTENVNIGQFGYTGLPSWPVWTCYSLIYKVSSGLQIFSFCFSNKRFKIFKYFTICRSQWYNKCSRTNIKPARGYSSKKAWITDQIYLCIFFEAKSWKFTKMNLFS